MVNNSIKETELLRLRGGLGYSANGIFANNKISFLAQKFARVKLCCVNS